MTATRRKPSAPAARRGSRRAGSAAVFSPAFAPQRAAASPRDLLLFELARARASVQAAVQGLAGGSAERPLAPGKWTVREVALHLVARDEARLAEFDALAAGTPASWAGLDHAAMAPINAAHLEALRDLDWDRALRRLHTTRDALLARILALPAEPESRWLPDHALGRALHALVEHDRHHAAQIKHARIAG
jgi:uncharacterized damage-inducible protein DinB